MLEENLKLFMPRKVNAEDYLHWEAKASLENYFELKHMAEGNVCET